MAFNPFQAFRNKRNQKIIFAFLTIMAMMTFVLIQGVGGGGDFASWLQQMVLGQGSKYPAVATIYGKKVTALDLREVLMQRQLANMYMIGATQMVLAAREKELLPPNAENLPPDHQRMLAQKIEADPLFRTLAQRIPNIFNPRRLYFSGTLSTEGLLDFMIWQQQADSLNIQLTEADIKREVDRLTAGKLTHVDSGKIEQGLRQNYKDYSSQMLIAAIGKELRVQLAQEALLGGGLGSITKMPAPITPEEFWEFYKEQQTKLTVRLIPVAVEEFLDQVKEKPTDKDLDDLYKKYKEKDYTPESSEPGFKQPRRVQVEWVSGRWDDPYYQEAAQAFLPTMQAVELVAAGAGSAGLGQAVQLGIPAVVDVLLPAAKDPRTGAITTIYREYENTAFRRYKIGSYVKAWTWLTSPFAFHDKNIQQPLNAAACVGQALGSQPQVAALAGFTTFLGDATLKEMQDRLEHGLTWLLSGGQPALANGFQPGPVARAALQSYLTPRNEYLPLSLVKEQVKQSLMEFLAQDLVVNNLMTIKKEVESKAKDPKAVAEYLAKASAEYHFKSGKTTEPRDENRKKPADDPNLQPLREAYLRPPARDAAGRFFNMLFFNDKKPYQVEFLRNSFVPLEEDREWKSAPEKFVYWKTDDQPAKVVPLAEIRADVERAWKMQKARDLAKKEAEQLSVKAREEKGDERKLRDFAEKHKRKLIELQPFAKRNQMPSFRPEFAYTYEAPRIPDDKVAHAGQEMVSKLLTLKEKEKGDTLVQPDEPQTTYYVAVLTDRQEPSVDDFLRVYREAASDSIRKDPLLQIFEQERQVQYIQEFMKRLREDAQLFIDKENVKAMESPGGAEE